MRLALICSRFAPESSPGAKRASDLCASLKAAGHKVTVLTQLPVPQERSIPPEGPEQNGVNIEDDGSGNAVWRFPPRTVSKGNLAGRLLSEARFARFASSARSRLSGLDGVVASTPFIFNLLAARRFHLPMWLDLRDLTWEYVRDLAPHSLVKRAGAAVLRSLALSSFRAASGVSTTTASQRRYLIERGVPSGKIHVVPNGVPLQVIEDLVRRSGACPKNAEGPLRVVYAGLLGFPQGLEFAVEAVEDMAGEGFELHLFGDGVDRALLAERCRAAGRHHVFVHGHVAYDDYLQSIATADVLLASLRPGVESAMPSKILEYMAAGKPILFVGSGEGADVVREAEAGATTAYGDKRLFQETLRELARDAALRRRLGENGRNWVMRHRVRGDVNRAWVAAIEAAFTGQPRATATSGAKGKRARPLLRLASASARGAELSGLLYLLESAQGGRSSRLRALTYHRVTDPESLPRPCPGLLSATPEVFARQMEFLAERYRVISIEDVLAAARSCAALPPRALVLTFDDAYCDFADHAWPVLKRLGLPVTLFVPTAYPDAPGRAFWWDRIFQAITATHAESVAAPYGTRPLSTDAERLDCFRGMREWIKTRPHQEAMECVDRVCRELGPGLPSPGVLGWDSLRALAKAGVALGAHTRTHALVDRIPIEQVREEISGSLEDLRREIGSALPIFAYPSGRHDDRSVQAVQEAGIELAFTTGGNVCDIRDGDRLRLGRIHVGPRITRPILRVQLLGIRPPAWLRTSAPRL